MKTPKTRRSRHSRCHCGAKLPLSPADELVQVKLEIEKAKLAKLQAELPDPDAPEYTRWEDLPPPSPEDEKCSMRNSNGCFVGFQRMTLKEKQPSQVPNFHRPIDGPPSSRYCVAS